MHRCLGCMREYKDEYQVCPYCGYEVGTPPKEAYHMVPGTLLAGRYTVGQVLGFGGFGVTYIGYDTVLERKVAIKEYLPSEFSTRIPGQTEITTYAGERTEQFNSGLTKFLEEAKMLAKLQSANGVVQIYNSFQENNTAYIVMEYLEGKTLKTYLEESGKIPVEEAKEILHPIIIALKEVHALGIIHRDIAPDNIFLTTDGKVKLLDFGASRFATTSHSKSLSVIIKQGYAPVEQYRSRGDQGPWTDVYSLSATLYKMITGVTPEDAMERIEKEELKKPSKLGIDIPKSTENAIMNAMNIKIEDRTQDIEAFENELYHDENVKLRAVHLKKADVGKWPLWMKLTVSGAGAAVAAFAVLLITGVISFSRIAIPEFMIPDGKTRVPNVVNEESDYAETTLKESELYFQIVDKQYSEYIPQDLVLAQSIDRGRIVDINSVVEVVISGGLEHVFMIDVCGYNKDEAVKLLGALGLSAELTEEYGDLAPGAVLKQSIAAGEETYSGTQVTLTISKGYDSYLDISQTVDVPDFTGMTFKEAMAAAKKCGLYIVKTGSKKGQMKVGCILEQTPAEGTKAHQGDVIEIITVEEESEAYMPDVQYKDEADAVAQLEALGLSVTVSYEESNQVAQGKIISQSIEAYTKIKTGTKVSLVVSLGNDEINKIMAQWSDWTTELPAEVNKKEYEIETKTQYSFRDKTTNSSSESTLPGWTYYDTVVTKGEYGPWSDWSTQKPEDKTNREVENKTQYASSDYETTSSEQATMAGWTQIGAETRYRDDYGAWSDWSLSEVSSSATREVETTTWYRYATRTKEYGESNSSSMSGWTLYDQKITSWSDWTETTTPSTATDSHQVEYVRTVPAVTHQNISYHYERHWGNKGFTTGGPDSSAGGYYEEYTSSTPLTGKTVQLSGGSYITAYWVENRYFYNEQPISETVIDVPAYDVYHERDGYYTYYFWKWSDWSGWSDWSAEAQSTSDEKQVDTATAYRYRDKNTYNWYTYERWTDYSGWTENPISETATRKVKTQTVYKYRDKQDVYTYYFYQWSDWSSWRDEKIEKSDSREVQTRTMYRYKAKQ